MNIGYKNFLPFIFAAVISFFILLQYNPGAEKKEHKRVRSASSPKANIEMKKARDDYFFYLLRDPASNKIPPNIRKKELQFARRLNEKNASLNKISANLSWAEAGPNNVGGRTRALAVDVNDPNTIIAGGASGGIWKSTDKGATWSLKSTSSTILSVSSIAQDPRPGFTNIWYYSTGEFSHNLAGTIGSSFTGDGIYKSVDNGETWNVLSSTHSPNVAQWDGDFDFVLKVEVSPANGYVYAAANAIGIFRSTDGGTSFTRVLGNVNHHIYSDVAVASNGTVLAVLSAAFQGTTPTISPGLYRSTNNGDNWTDITPDSYPAGSLRSVVEIAPSNPNTGYLFTNTGLVINEKEVNKFYKININAGSSEDRSGNLPDFTSLGGVAASVGYVTTQGGYDMIVAVKPDNENFVLVGGSSLFLSTDGFATLPSDNKTAWIGGYHPQSFGYPNFHADVHSFAFDPTDPKKMWWGHDGGLSYTSDITNTSYQTYFPWENKNNGYNVTQFYHISISRNSGDNRIMGGTQDNGTPFFIYNGATANQIDDVSSGDGSFSYFGQNFAYTSSQSGNVNRLRYDQEGNPAWNAGWSNITPTDASNQFFINPFVVDPSDENIMYYPSGNVLWRNNMLGSIDDFQNGTSTGWTQLNNTTVPAGYGIYALNVSTTPSHILYYAAFNPQGTPKLYKLINSNTSSNSGEEISVPGAADGAYISDIAVNPDDANEIIVVMSNYNITGLYHSVNGGDNYNAVEGNLEGTQQNPGPSLRAATILPSGGGKTYYLATSIGLFSTTLLNGNSTVWTQEGQNVLGNVIVSSVSSRKSDGRVVAGTHGRGAFVGSTGGGGGAALLEVNSSQLNISVYPGLSRSTSFRISNPGGAQLTYSITASGGDVNVREKEYADLPEQSFMLKNKAPLSSQYQNRLIIQRNRKADRSELFKPAAIEELILDDGNSSPSGFLGAGGTVYFYSANNFQVTKDFSLQSVKFFMKTEDKNTNPLRLVVTSNDNILFDTTVNKETSPPEGKWFEFAFPQYIRNQLRFQNGNSFQLVVITLNTELTFPAGFDETNAQVTDNSYWAYYDPLYSFFTGWINLNGIAENGAFLIRAVGDAGGGGGTNQAPVANALVSPNPAGINQSVSFNGSGSSDPDGQITNYLWEFGDGQTGTEANTTHSYAEAGQFTYKLTVTDNNGATNQTSGQITVTDNSGSARFTVSPLTGNISAGGFQDILVTYNSQGVPEGNYQGQLNITSNGGNTVIPVNILISATVNVEDKTEVYSYRLSQNYPNPFNPSTVIDFQVPASGLVTIKVYDIHGEEVAILLNEEKGMGRYYVRFNAAGLASGIYFYKITSNNFSETKKMILLK